MRMIEWDQLPGQMQNDEVKFYYQALKSKRVSLCGKRLFDVALAILLLVLLSPLFLGVAVVVRWDSKGPVFYRQVRITQYGREFRIFKFRTMVEGADKIGAYVTSKDDARVTKAGCFLRKFRLDEIPQLLNVISGDMTFVGTRPEVPKYVKHYASEMQATLLLPAGITSEASILYKDEEKLLDSKADIDKVYVEQVLPGKMRYNLQYLRHYSFWRDIGIMMNTVIKVTG